MTDNKTENEINLNIATADLSALSRDQLKAMIRETKENLALLKAEIKKRKDDRRHDDIDHLDEYLEEASINLAGIKKFIQRMKDERD